MRASRVDVIHLNAHVIAHDRDDAGVSTHARTQSLSRANVKSGEMIHERYRSALCNSKAEQIAEEERLEKVESIGSVEAARGSQVVLNRRGTWRADP